MFKFSNALLCWMISRWWSWRPLSIFEHGEGEQNEDDVLVNFINLWSSHTTRLLEKRGVRIFVTDECTRTDRQKNCVSYNWAASLFVHYFSCPKQLNTIGNRWPCHSLTHSVSHSGLFKKLKGRPKRPVTFETFDQSDEETWHFDTFWQSWQFWQFLTILDNFGQFGLWEPLRCGQGSISPQV